jgi:hypothetical protein
MKIVSALSFLAVGACATPTESGVAAHMRHERNSMLAEQAAALAADPPTRDGGVRTEYQHTFVPSHSRPRRPITADDISMELQAVETELYPCPEIAICGSFRMRPVSEVRCRPGSEAETMTCNFQVYFNENGGFTRQCSFPVRLSGERWNMGRLYLSAACRIVAKGLRAF